jgi:hypothetical protein
MITMMTFNILTFMYSKSQKYNNRVNQGSNLLVWLQSSIAAYLGSFLTVTIIVLLLVITGIITIIIREKSIIILLNTDIFTYAHLGA